VFRNSVAASDIMKLYFSGPHTHHPRMLEAAAICPFRLLSCADAYVRELDFWMRVSLERGNTTQEIMLDSGAFTAWSKSKEAKLSNVAKTYRAFLRKHEKHIKAVWLINLDRIPGTKGVEPTQKEILDALDESDENFKALSSEFGGRVLPVYHQGEPDSRLREVVSQAEYICVSPRNDLPERSRVQWSRAVHDRLSSKRTRTHGLATTGHNMATSVPWYSADSASWRHTALYGGIVLGYEDGLKRIAISSDSSQRYSYNRHADALSPGKARWLLERVQSRGFTLEELKTSFQSRAVFSMYEMIEWNLSAPSKIINAPTLFGV
jgi:hypothetical protein